MVDEGVAGVGVAGKGGRWECALICRIILYYDADQTTIAAGAIQSRIRSK